MINQLLQLIKKTSCEIPLDIRDALQRASIVETNPCARSVFNAISQNITLATDQQTPLCQDTGTLTFFWRIPRGTDTLPIENACREATKRATHEGFLRKNTIDTLTGVSINENVGESVPMMHFHQEDGLTHPIVTLLLKGGGSENMSRQYMLPDERLNAERDLAGVRKCILHAVNEIQGQGCSPGIIGVCIGADRAEGYIVAKKQLLRMLDDHANVPELATLEQQILDEANTLNIGPMGTGGKTTLLGVKIATRTRLPASYFVTIAYMCWACRRQSAIINL